MNLPSAVEVEIDDGGLPVAVRRRGETAGRRSSDTPTSHPRSGQQGSPVEGAVRGEIPSSRQVVQNVIEVWRVEDEWWRTPIDRCYVEVVLEGGTHVVLFEDLTTAQWYFQLP